MLSGWGLIFLFLHIGGEYAVAFRNIVFIFDCSKCENKINSEFIKKVSDEGNVIDISNSNAKSVICAVDGRNERTLYLSNISAIALKHRYETILNLFNRV